MHARARGAGSVHDPTPVFLNTAGGARPISGRSIARCHRPPSRCPAAPRCPAAAPPLPRRVPRVAVGVACGRGAGGPKAARHPPHAPPLEAVGELRPPPSPRLGRLLRRGARTASLGWIARSSPPVPSGGTSVREGAAGPGDPFALAYFTTNRPHKGGRLRVRALRASRRPRVPVIIASKNPLHGPRAKQWCFSTPPPGSV